jgi:hypothetical protein
MHSNDSRTDSPIFHMHVYLKLEKKCDISSRNKLRLEFENEVFDGNYSSVGNLSLLLIYITKEKDFITNMERNELENLLSNKSNKTVKDEFHIKLLEIREKEGLKAALDYFRQIYVVET